MAFIDRAGMFKPVTNQFSGLGKAIGTGFVQAAKNRLFDNLQKTYMDAAPPKAKMQALSTLGLVEEPDPIKQPQQYAAFRQVLENQMAEAQGRANLGRAVMGIDEQKGLDYLLRESKMANAPKAEKTKAEAMALLATPEGQRARANYDSAWEKYNQAAINLLNNPFDPKAIQADAQAREQFFAAELDFVQTVKMKPAEIGLRSGSQIEKAREVTGQIKDQGISTNTKIEDAIQKAYKLVKEDSDIQKRMPSINKTVQKAQDTLNAYADIKQYIDSFDKIKLKPGVAFGAIKRLAQLIEPGLQVTTDEVRGFEGDGRIKAIMQGGDRLIEAAKTLFNKTELMEAAYSAGEPNPQGLWDALVQATNIANNSMNIYKNATTAAKEKANKVAGNSLEAFVFTNGAIPEDRKPQVAKTALGQIGFSIPSNIETAKIVAIPLGTPMPGSTVPEVEDGNEDKPLTEAEKAEAAAAKRAQSGSSASGVAGIAGNEAAKVGDKVVDDFFESQGIR